MEEGAVLCQVQECTPESGAASSCLCCSLHEKKTEWKETTKQREEEKRTKSEEGSCEYE